MSDNAHEIAAAAEPIKLAETVQASSGTVNNSENLTAGNGSNLKDGSNTKDPETNKSKRASGGIDNFRLGQKAVLLVSVPLIFQIAFATTLFTLLTQSRIEARKGQIANEVTLRTGALVEHMVEAGKALAVYGMAHQEAARDRFLKRLDMMPADLAAVYDLERRAPETKGSLEKIVSTSRLTMTYLTESERLFELGETKAGLNYMKRLQGVYEELTEYLETVRLEYNKVIKSVPKQQEKFGELIDLALLLSIPANIGLAVYLALRINKNVTRRLQVIMDNSRRLEQERELNEELTGSDEIADLDRVFHGVAASIRQSAEALRKSESQIRALIEKMPVGVITLTPDGTIDSLNPEAENIFQVPSREVRGQSCVFLLEPALSTEQLLGKLAALKRGALDARGVRSSGESFDARIMVNELSDTTGGLLLNVQDVSEQKAVERMKREFMQMVSHDLRTPLSYKTNFRNV